MTQTIIPAKRPAVWHYQIFNLNSFIILSLIVFSLFAEVRFNFIEKMIGNYLKWNNNEKQKLGRMWNVEQQSVAAMGQLNELLVEKEAKQKKIDSIESFAELLEHLKTDRLISMSKEQFVKIYNRLSPNISNKIIDTYSLINYLHRSNWVKTFMLKKTNGIEIIMVDGRFGVIKSIFISDRNAYYFANYGKIIIGSLESLDELNNRIYDVSEFMEALYKLDRDERDKIIYSPYNFLRWGNSLKRVGISEISEDNLVQVGFEIHSSNKKKVVMVYIEDFIILNLIHNLTGKVKEAELENDFSWEE